jgi:hypothetical protein
VSLPGESLLLRERAVDVDDAGLQPARLNGTTGYLFVADESRVVNGTNLRVVGARR